MTFLTPKECAAKANVSLSLIYAALNQRLLPALRIGTTGRGKWLISAEDFDNWIQSCRVSELPQTKQ